MILNYYVIDTRLLLPLIVVEIHDFFFYVHDTPSPVVQCNSSCLFLDAPLHLYPAVVVCSYFPLVMFLMLLLERPLFTLHSLSFILRFVKLHLTFTPPMKRFCPHDLRFDAQAMQEL